MKKFFVFFIGTIVLIVASLFFAWNYFPNWIAHSLSKKMGVTVMISHVNFTPKTIGVYNISIGNPQGCILPKALIVERIKTQAPLSRFFNQHIVIDEMVLSDLYLGLEFESALNSKGNWSKIMERMQGQSTPSEPKSILIKKLVLKNLKIDLVFRNDGQVKHLKPIPYMEFQNVSSEGGLPTEQLANIILSEMLKEVFSRENLMKLLKGILQPQSQGLNPIYNSLRPFFS